MPQVFLFVKWANSPFTGLLLEHLAHGLPQRKCLMHASSLTSQGTRIGLPLSPQGPHEEDIFVSTPFTGYEDEA